MIDEFTIKSSTFDYWRVSYLWPGGQLRVSPQCGACLALGGQRSMTDLTFIRSLNTSYSEIESDRE